MSIDFDDAQRQAVAQGEPVHGRDPETGVDFVLIRAEEYARLLDKATETDARRAWLAQATRSRRRWVRENPY